MISLKKKEHPMTSSLTGQKMVAPSGKSGNKLPPGHKLAQIQQLTPEQMELLSQMAERLGPDSWLARLAAGDESMFDEMEAPALKQFSALQGNIASRFSGMGQGARSSSGFQNTMTQAGSDFAQQLQSKRMDLRNQAMKDLMGYSSDFLDKRPYEQMLYEKEPGFLGKVAGGALRAGGAAVGGYYGGMEGAKLGYGAGKDFASAFGV